MNPPILLRTILLRMWRHKLKTVFMGLGITVAVLATVVLQTVAGSVRDKFYSFLERAYPSDGVVLMGGSGPMGGPAGRNSVKLHEVETVANSLGVTEWDPILFVGSRDVRHAANNLRVGLAGYSEKAESVRRLSVQEGEFLSADDIRGRAKVALIGTTTARTLFPDGSPVGSQVFIDNVPFRIKGILEPMGVDVHGGDQDNAIRIPYTTLMDMARVDYVSATTFIIGNPNRAEPVREEINRIMREQHQIGEGQKDGGIHLTPPAARRLE